MRRGGLAVGHPVEKTRGREKAGDRGKKKERNNKIVRWLVLSVGIEFDECSETVGRVLYNADMVG